LAAAFASRRCPFLVMFRDGDEEGQAEFSFTSRTASRSGQPFRSRTPGDPPNITTSQGHAQEFSEMKTRPAPLHLIPDITKNGHRRLAKAAAKQSRLLKAAEETAVVVSSDGAVEEPASAELAPWDLETGCIRFMRDCADRLIVNFEVRNLTHNQNSWR